MLLNGLSNVVKPFLQIQHGTGVAHSYKFKACLGVIKLQGSMVFAHLFKKIHIDSIYTHINCSPFCNKTGSTLLSKVVSIAVNFKRAKQNNAWLFLHFKTTKIIGLLTTEEILTSNKLPFS